MVVPVGGLEPPRPKATDFESVVYTNFTTPAHIQVSVYLKWAYNTRNSFCVNDFLPFCLI